MQPKNEQKKSRPSKRHEHLTIQISMGRSIYVNDLMLCCSMRTLPFYIFQTWNVCVILVNETPRPTTNDRSFIFKNERLARDEFDVVDVIKNQ